MLKFSFPSIFTHKDRRGEQQALDALQRDLDEIEKKVSLPGYARRIDPYVVEHEQAGIPFKLVIYNHNSKSWYGDTSKQDSSLKILSATNFLRAGDVALDLGCNTGFITTWYAKRVGESGHVHAVDPFPWNTAGAKCQAAINGLSNVTTHTVAVGADEREIRIPLKEARSVETDDEWSLPARVVPMSYFSRYKPSFAKFDIEGAEYEAFEGWERDTIDRAFMEYHGHFIDQRGLDPSRIFYRAAELGFSIHQGNPGAPPLAASSALKPNLRGSYYFTR